MKNFVLVAGALLACVFLTSPVSAQIDCSSNITDCESCVAHLTGCYWCDAPASGKPNCQSAASGGFLTDITDCPGYQWKWGQCILNGIVIAVLLALLLILVIGALCFLVCCIACCCRRRRIERVARADYQYQRERQAIKDEHSRKKDEKSTRREEMRKKYGLFDDNGTQEN